MIPPGDAPGPAGIVAGLADIAGGLGPESVVMLTGAGVSVEGPASLPTGAELTARVFGAFFDDHSLSSVVSHHATVGWWLADPCARADSAQVPRPPRLETVLGVAAAVHGGDAIAAVLGDVAGAQPNRLHRFLAAHLDRGGRQLTANFDTCVEQAADESFPGWQDRGRIFHFHGSMAEDPAGNSLGATLERIQGGFAEADADRFREMLPDSGIILVLGYSGGDFFDVDTAIAALDPGSLDQVRVIWVAHSDRPWRLADPLAAEAPPLARHLIRAGADVSIACGPTAEFIAALARRWGVPRPGPASTRAVRNPVVVADPSTRHAATFVLYGELGLHDETAEMLADHSASVRDVTRLLGPAAVWQARSALLWEQGRWDTLRWIWQHGRPPSALRGITRAERIGACLWVQGRLVPAWVWLTWHRRRSQDPAARLELAETEGRVIEHMSRTPELRPLALRLAPGLIRLLGETGQAAGIHLYRRHGDLSSSLRAVTGQPRPAAEAATSSQWFTEAGNLTAALNYRHRHYRDTYQATAVSDRELARRYRELQAHFAAVGSPNGYWRTHLLPGAERVYTTTEIIQGLLALQYGWWHRIRLLTRFLPLRLRHQIGGKSWYSG